MIAVLTCARQVSYLAATLAGIDESATDLNKVVVVDGDEAPTVPAGWRVVLAPKPASAWRTENRIPFWSVLELAVGAGEDLLFFEDDVLPCRNAVRYAQALAIPDDVAFVSLYGPFGDQATPPGLVLTPAIRFVYCQAVKFPLRTCQALVDHRSEMLRSRMGGSDNCVAMIGHSLGWRYATHYPSLFQHVGVYSAVGNAPVIGRVSKAFDPDFDPMKAA